MRRLYAGVGPLHGRLARAGARGARRARLLDDTLVIVTSDHGENLGEGGLVGHAFSLDDRLIRVPFVDGRPASPLDARARLADLPRVLADALGLDDHPWQRPRRGAAVSAGRPADPARRPARRPARSPPGASTRRPRGGSRRRSRRRATAAFKLVRQGDDRVAATTCDADPLEAAPLATVPAGDEARVAALRTALDHPSVWAAPEATHPARHGRPRRGRGARAPDAHARLPLSSAPEVAGRPRAAGRARTSHVAASGHRRRRPRARARGHRRGPLPVLDQAQRARITSERGDRRRERPQRVPRQAEPAEQPRAGRRRAAPGSRPSPPATPPRTPRARTRRAAAR